MIIYFIPSSPRVTEVESCNTTATVFCSEYTTQSLLVRLVAGSVISEGQLQVFHQGYWGYVCDTGFGLEEARVVCRQLGFPGAIRALLNSPFTSDSGKVWLSSLQCTGNESNVAECYQQSWGGSSCSGGHEVGVQCTAPAHPIKLVGANSSTEGTVLVSFHRKETFFGGFLESEKVPNFRENLVEFQVQKDPFLVVPQRSNGLSTVNSLLVELIYC